VEDEDTSSTHTHTHAHAHAQKALMGGILSSLQALNQNSPAINTQHIQVIMRHTHLHPQSTGQCSVVSHPKGCYTNIKLAYCPDLKWKAK